MILVKNFNFFSKSLDEYLEHPLISELYSEMYPYDIDAWSIFYDAHYLCTWIYNQEHPEVDYNRKIENILAEFEEKSDPAYVLATAYAMLKYIDAYDPCCYNVIRFIKCLSVYMGQHQMSFRLIKFETIADKVISVAVNRALINSQGNYFDTFKQFDLDFSCASGYIFEKEIVEKVISGYSPDRIKEALECFCYDKEKIRFAELIIEYCPKIEYLDFIEKILLKMYPDINLFYTKINKRRESLSLISCSEKEIETETNLFQWLQEENRELKQKLEAQEKAYKNSESIVKKIVANRVEPESTQNSNNEQESQCYTKYNFTTAEVIHLVHHAGLVASGSNASDWAAVLHMLTGCSINTLRTKFNKQDNLTEGKKVQVEKKYKEVLSQIKKQK